VTSSNSGNFNSYFDDPYFNTDNGCAESDYVFLQGNSLTQRWRKQDQLRIGELGYGTGLNLHLLLTRMLEDPECRVTKLYYSSLEKYPLSMDAAKNILAPFSKRIIPLIEELYPKKGTPWYGKNLNLGKMELYFQLCVSDIRDYFTPPPFADGFPADAWFLDGHDPKKNPRMWSEEVFLELHHRSHSTTSFATFTAAGAVRRALAAAGFKVERIKGYGNKRHMIRGWVE
jgi:tRNA 5-methylaminomethyl-2-thiouridine biosynthesis bifunctional protein